MLVMAKYTEEELNKCSKKMLISLFLSMQDQLEALNKNMELLIEQVAMSNQRRFGRSSEQQISGQLTLSDYFNEIEAIMENKYIIKGSLELACEMSIIDNNPYNNIRINRRLCRHVVKKANTKEIYFEDEIKLLYDALDKELSDYPDCSTCLTIKFLFQTGLRISEATAIKFSDISDGDIYIRCMETRCSSYNPTDTSFSKSEFQVVEHTKTKNDAGCRYIPLTPTALNIIEQARHINETYGYATDDFIFCTKEGRITSRQVTYRLKKCCKKANIPFKSPHKIRKTFASTLCNNNLNIEIIRLILGHTNDTTTYNYIFNPHTDATTRKLFTDALK